MQDVVLASLDLAGGDGAGAARVDDDDPPLRVRLAGKLLLLLLQAVCRANSESSG
mgnify:CR=1 FL=1